jgi:phospholipid/cholesterol/gamma-HCH transport system substrate-binding protein
MGEMLRSLLARLGMAAAFAAVVAGGVLVSRLAFQPAPYRVSVPVRDAAGLYPGSDVMVAGARAGQVEAVTLQGGAALVTVGVDAEHAPLRTDATIGIRPKSLLGERYVALDPGQAPGTLPSGATLPATAVTGSTSLEDVVNTFDQPTRDKLQTLVVELGGGVAGRGEEVNAGLHAGKEDLGSLRGIADTLASRDADLQTVIADLDSVLQELARSDRRQQLGQLIQSLEALLGNLADQDAQLKQALAEANSALSRTDVALEGTGGSLADIVSQVPATVHLADLIMADLGPDTDMLMPHLQQLDAAVASGPAVFGGLDASGYATRISVLAGCSTAGLCPGGGSGGTVPLQAGAGSPAAAPGQASAKAPPAASAGAANPPAVASGTAALGGQDPGLNAIADLLLGRSGR